MIPSFFALLSKAGIACAADTDHTIYRLSKDLPVALAVNPESPIPWDRIISDYSLTKPKEHDFFADYAMDFNLYLVSLDVEEKWNCLTPETSNIIFLGFGSEDIYPSMFDVRVKISDEGNLDFEEPKIICVDQSKPVIFPYLGNFESVSTLLLGTTRDTREFFMKKHKEMFETYAERLLNEFKGTQYEEYVTKHLDAYDVEEDIERKLRFATSKTVSELVMGVDAFSVEDMVTAVESLVNANAKLSHLHDGGRGKPKETKEIAVVTIPEGLSWIEHSIYNRRTEI